MLELKPIEFFLRVLPESFLFIFGIYLFSSMKVDKNKFVMSSILYAIIGYGVRLLPLTYGIHTVISIVAAILIVTIINKINMIKSISSTIIIFIIQFITEGINIFFLQNVLNLDLDYIFKQPIQKNIYGLPSLIMVAIILIVSYKIKWKDGDL